MAAVRARPLGPRQATPASAARQRGWATRSAARWVCARVAAVTPSATNSAKAIWPSIVGFPRPAAYDVTQRPLQEQRCGSAAAPAHLAAATSQLIGQGSRPSQEDHHFTDKPALDLGGDWSAVPSVSASPIAALPKASFAHLTAPPVIPGDEAVEEQIVGDRHRDAGDQGPGHDLAPVEDVAANQIGRHAQRDRLLIG